MHPAWTIRSQIFGSVWVMAVNSCRIETTHHVPILYHTSCEIIFQQAQAIFVSLHNLSKLLQRHAAWESLSQSQCLTAAVTSKLTASSSFSFQRMPDRRVSDDNFIHHVRLLPHPRVSNSQRRVLPRSRNHYQGRAGSRRI
jgi:hypothetical protein